MKLLSHPTVVNGQIHSKNQAYHQQRAPDYLVVHINLFLTFPTRPTQNPKTIVYNKKSKKKN
jgi:hypothetical protein